jgi:hypothetical protein
MKEQMEARITSKSTYSRRCHELHELRRELPTSDGLAEATVLCLTRRGSLMLALLLSLGLWAAIWAAVASLTSAILG